MSNAQTTAGVKEQCRRTIPDCYSHCGGNKLILGMTTYPVNTFLSSFFFLDLSNVFGVLVQQGIITGQTASLIPTTLT